MVATLWLCKVYQPFVHEGTQVSHESLNYNFNQATAPWYKVSKDNCAEVSITPRSPQTAVCCYLLTYNTDLPIVPF